MRWLGYMILVCLTLSGCRSSWNNKALVIGIQPYSNMDQDVVDEVAKHLEQAFSARIVVYDKRELPSSAFIQVKSSRYRADSLLLDLKRIKPDSIAFLLGLTASDISVTKRNSDGTIKDPASKYADWGVFGLGFRPGPTCVVSTFRLKNEPTKFKDRLLKVCTHELGHNLGLKHCDSEGCVMQDAAETIKTIDRVENEFCERCRGFLPNGPG